MSLAAFTAIESMMDEDPLARLMGLEAFMGLLDEESRALCLMLRGLRDKFGRNEPISSRDVIAAIAASDRLVAEHHALSDLLINRAATLKPPGEPVAPKEEPLQTVH